MPKNRLPLHTFVNSAILSCSFVPCYLAKAFIYVMKVTWWILWSFLGYLTQEYSNTDMHFFETKHFKWKRRWWHKMDCAIMWKHFLLRLYCWPTFGLAKSKIEAQQLFVCRVYHHHDEGEYPWGNTQGWFIV